ncbi:hypothetical protein LCGC14_1553120 [marine sediment metagenome]|uniref:Uncharacterized protein n=1 Tax=marine sediment metagenome TaxID=412755 RepID=A0A0F9IPU7_9ZZZZ
MWIVRAIKLRLARVVRFLMVAATAVFGLILLVLAWVIVAFEDGP